MRERGGGVGEGRETEGARDRARKIETSRFPRDWLRTMVSNSSE